MSETVAAHATIAHATEGGAEDPLVSVRNLKTHFGLGTGFFGSGGSVVKAVDGVSFDIHRGEVFGLVGESGSGKSTLGRSLLQLIKPTSGEVIYQGRDLVPLKEKGMRPLRRELGLIQQDPNAALNPAMTIGQGVGHPLIIHGLVSSNEEARERVSEMLERVGLYPARKFLDIYPDDISGGQKQRLVIARALITKPHFVVADEPVAALDMSVRARVLELMLELKQELNLTYVFITHDLATARFMCDTIGILYLGNFVERGGADELFSAPQHPYTKALLGAIPLPEAGRRNREKILPHGEIPDAARPPRGCQFHPRCPAAFGPCGWEGRDLIEAIEEHWTELDPDALEAEHALMKGLEDVDVDVQTVRIGTDDPDALVTWLEKELPTMESRVHYGIQEITAQPGSVVVTFLDGAEPAEQTVAGRRVACHLYGVVPRQDGQHVGDSSKIHVTEPPIEVIPSWHPGSPN